MGLDIAYQNRIKESMDLDEGGTLHAIAQKAAAVNAPVLIIGLGGTGLDALIRVKKMIYDTIQSEIMQDGRITDKPKNIEYMGFDTDQNYRNKKFQGISLSEVDKEVNIMLMPQVQPVLQHPEQLPPYINKWLDTDIPNTTVTEGAGAVRQLGRLLFMQNIGTITQVLQNKINKVKTGYASNIPLYIFYIAGISGGTGSGSFLDMPYLARAISQQHEAARPVRNIGILVMPDVNANKNGVGTVTRESIYANGYASLKELEYLMNIEKTGDTFSQNYGVVRAGTSIEGTAVAPYDICLLMSSKDKNGMSVGTGDECYDNVLNIIAETIFNFVVGDTGTTNPNNFSISSWLANEGRNISTYGTMLGDDRHPVAYQYSIAGCSSAQLPLNEVMSYLTYKAFKQIDGIWNQIPSDAIIEGVEKFFHLEEKTLEHEGRLKLPVAQPGTIKVSDIKQNPSILVKIFENNLKKQEAQIDINIENMLENLQNRVNDKTNLIYEYFLDMEKGPVFAQGCLYSTWHRSVITDLRNTKIHFVNDIIDVEKMEKLNIDSVNALSDVKKVWTDADVKGCTGKYIKCMEQEYAAKLKNSLYRKLEDFCLKADGILTKANNELFDIIADLLNQMIPLFEKYGKIQTKTRLVSRENGNTLSWHIVDVPTFITEIDNEMSKNPNFSVNLEAVIQNFYKFLLNNTEKWRGDEGDVIEDINSFIYNQFMNILGKTMDFFLDIIARSQRKTLNQYCTEIINTLMDNAEVHYPIDTSFMAQIAPPSYSFISIPSNCPSLLAAAQQLAQSRAGSIVKTSGIRDRIFMMNFQSATPLSLNPDLKAFYDIYMKHRKTQSGIHYYIPTKFDESTDWKLLPSPLPETEWRGFYDEEEHNRNEEYRKIFEKALKYKYIVEDVAERSYTCYYGKPVDIKSIVDKYSITLGDSGIINGKDAKNAARKLQDSLLDRERLNSSIQRKEMVSKDDGATLDRPYEEIMFIQMFRIRDKIKEMVENHEQVLAAIQEIRERGVSDDLITDFIECRILKLIDKRKNELGSYIFLDRKNAARPLVKLDGKKMKYQEHFLMDAFISIDPVQKKELQKKAQERINDPALAETNKKVLDVFRKKMVEDILDDLRYDYLEIDNGETILLSYQMLEEACENVARLLGEDQVEDDEFDF